MTNKKMLENMKKHGVKSVAGILLAVTLMSTAVPVLAEPAQAAGGAVTQASVGMTDAENIVTQNTGPVLLDDAAQAGGTEEASAVSGDNQAAQDNGEAQDNDTAQDNGVAGNDTDAKADENADAGPDENTDAEPDKKPDEKEKQVGATGRTEEIKKQVAAAAAAEKEKKEAAEKDQQEAIKKAGGIFANLVIEASKLNYSDADNVKESLAKLSKTALKQINEAFLKDIPYAGGCINQIISALTGVQTDDKADITNQKLTEVISSIDKLNSTVEISTKKILDAQRREIIDNKIRDINNKMETFFTTFTRTTGDYDAAMRSLCSTTPSAIRIQENMESVYNTNMNGATIGNGTSYYAAYIDYLNAIMDKKMVTSYDNNSVFALYDEVAQSQSNLIGKYNAKRTELVNNIQSISATGYIELKTAMGLDMTNCINSYNLYQEIVSKLRQQILKCEDQAEIDALDQKYEDCIAQMVDYDKRISTTKANLAKLESTYNEMLKMINNQNGLIAKDERDLANFLNQINKKVKTDGGNVCTEMDLNTSSTFEDGKQVDVTVHVYPRISDDKSQIEYTDEYNNVIATRKINKETEVKDIYQIKEGETYTFIKTYTSNPDKQLPEGCKGKWQVTYTPGRSSTRWVVTETVTVHIDKVDEVEKTGLLDKLFKNTNHVITGTYINMRNGGQFKYVHGEDRAWEKIIRHETLGEIELVKS